MPATSHPLRDTWTTVEGLPIYARTSTESACAGTRPIVLIHGYLVSSQYMVPTAERLAPFYPVYAPDLPGSGRSGTPARALSIAELSNFLAAWMAAIGLRNATLIGNSFGSQIIVDLALRHPGMVTHAVLVGPTVDPSARWAPHLVWRLALDALRERPSLVAIALRDYWRYGFRRGLATLRIMLADRIEEKLPHLTLPTLIVRGGRDPIVPQEWADMVASLIPKGRLIVIPGAAHAVNYDAPAALADAVHLFLGDQPGGACGYGTTVR